MSTHAPNKRRTIFWLTLGLLCVIAVGIFHLYHASMTYEPLVDQWRLKHKTNASFKSIRLNPYANRVVVVISKDLLEDQREDLASLIQSLNRAGRLQYDPYVSLIPFRSETKVPPAMARVSLPPPPKERPGSRSPLPQINDLIQDTESPPQPEPPRAPEGEEAARARKMAQLRWLALLEGVTVGTMYRDGTPVTTFTGTLFNRHDRPLKHGMIRLTLYAPRGQLVTYQDFTLVPFINTSISLSGQLPPKYRLPFSFTLSDPLPAGWTTRAEMVVIDYDEPTESPRIATPPIR